MVLGVFAAAFRGAFMAEVRLDRTLCAGGALAVRYAALPVMVGTGAALLLKMLLVAYAGAFLLTSLPPEFRTLPRLLTGAVFAVTSFLLLGLRSPWHGRLPVVMPPQTGGGATSGPRLDPDRPEDFWRVARTAFAILFLAEWLDGSQLLVATAAADGINTVGALAPLLAALGGAMALAVKDGFGVLLGTRLRSRVSTSRLRLTMAAVCAVLAVWTIAKDEQEDESARAAPRELHASFGAQAPRGPSAPGARLPHTRRVQTAVARKPSITRMSVTLSHWPNSGGRPRPEAMPRPPTMK